MVLYANTHAALEQMRQKAETEDSRGPRVGGVTLSLSALHLPYCRVGGLTLSLSALHLPYCGVGGTNFIFKCTASPLLWGRGG